MREFGQMLGCVEMGVPPEGFAFVEGIAEAMAGEKSASSGRILVKAARDLMCSTGRGHEAPAFHLHFIYKSADWNQHCQDAADHITQVLQLLDPMKKQAFTAGDAMAAGGLAGRGALYGSMGLGGGLGALYWLLSRHANQDDADVESMQHQVDYYNHLSHELSDSMKRKYEYDNAQQMTGRKPRAY